MVTYITLFSYPTFLGSLSYYPFPFFSFYFLPRSLDIKGRGYCFPFLLFPFYFLSHSLDIIPNSHVSNLIFFPADLINFSPNYLAKFLLITWWFCVEIITHFFPSDILQWMSNVHDILETHPLLQVQFTCCLSAVFSLSEKTVMAVRMANSALSRLNLYTFLQIVTILWTTSFSRKENPSNSSKKTFKIKKWLFFYRWGLLMKSTKDAITLKKIERKKILYPYMKKILREGFFHLISLKKILIPTCRTPWAPGCLVRLCPRWWACRSGCWRTRCCRSTRRTAELSAASNTR